MSQEFTITIAALDQFSGVFQAVNASATKALAPVAKTQGKVAEATKRMRLPEFGKTMQSVAASTAKFAESLGLAASPMGALFSGGALLGVGALGAALTALTVRWGDAGFNIRQTAASLGVSTKMLQEWRGAAELAGLKGEDAEQALGSLGDTLRHVINQDPEGQKASSLFRHLGIDIDRTKTAAEQIEPVLLRLSQALKNTADPTTQRAIAEWAGNLGPLLPLLRLGPDEIQRRFAEVSSRGAVRGDEDLAGAEKLFASLKRLGLAASGLANRIGNLLGPSLSVLLNLLSWTMAPAPAVVGPRLARSGYPHDLYNPADARGWENFAGVPGASATSVLPNVPASAPSGPGLHNPVRRWNLEGGRYVSPADMHADDADRIRMRQDEAVGADARTAAALQREIGRLQTNVNVTVHAPPGTVVRATSDSASAPVRVQRAMP